MARGSPARPERRPGRSRCGACDVEQAERRFLWLLAEERAGPFRGSALGQHLPFRGAWVTGSFAP
jgi:hypothetical protein